MASMVNSVSWFTMADPQPVTSSVQVLCSPDRSAIETRGGRLLRSLRLDVGLRSAAVEPNVFHALVVHAGALAPT